ncbi:TlpA family protein disulfide reductase [Opitutus terrae]|uniref:Alkyl hydroperoxide reductase/ Thiol specific antioxidant/ Mal allergen n=1 Tax=Opitutus terrae (strain DSM 11246 / JCM 15787 / PB90-1) TaxID=452637 RepID=B1ZMV0_OPITP|nr:TlpA disulfide reductase family protein [Opitutus terrae]ACB75378.1 alkyl hydroperoxide reductase/ Thiol specific antioxidant/ Mal allergen [Opitutus terrae PB90-1]
MKTRILFACGCLGLGGAVATAAESSVAPAAVSAPAASVSTVQDELRTLVEKVRAKLSSGVRTEAALAEELKAFDALLAAHASEKTDEVAQVLLMKAMLYLQVFDDADRGAELLTQLKRDFPTTQLAGKVDEVLQQIEQQRESAALRAKLKPDAVFPDFTEQDLNGAPLSISGLKGKVVLVDFWATWCGPCVAELPNVLAAYGKYHDKGFEIVGISLDRSEDALKKFIAEKQMTWPQYFDGKAWDSKLGRQYGITSIPATFLLDRDGKIIARDLRGKELEAELAKALGE